MAKLLPLTFRIAKLWGSPQGTVEKHLLDETISYPDKTLDFASNFTGELMLIKMKEEISVLLNNGAIAIHFICQRCLKPFIEVIKIESAERQFLFEIPSGVEVEDTTDVYVIDRKMMTIDLNEMVRQEIILHFPFIPVCSKGCKGLCPHCGIDRNTKKCTCESGDIETHKPFANLKKIITKSSKKTE